VCRVSSDITVSGGRLGKTVLSRRRAPNLDPWGSAPAHGCDYSRSAPCVARSALIPPPPFRVYTHRCVLFSHAQVKPCTPELIKWSNTVVTDLSCARLVADSDRLLGAKPVVVFVVACSASLAPFKTTESEVLIGCPSVALLRHIDMEIYRCNNCHVR
jgi:hypothetical protein